MALTSYVGLVQVVCLLQRYVVPEPNIDFEQNLHAFHIHFLLTFKTLLLIDLSIPLSSIQLGLLLRVHLGKILKWLKFDLSLRCYTRRDMSNEKLL